MLFHFLRRQMWGVDMNDWHMSKALCEEHSRSMKRNLIFLKILTCVDFILVYVTWNCMQQSKVVLFVVTQNIVCH